MTRCSKFSKELKTEIVQRYLQGERPAILIQRYGFNKSSLRWWIKKYQRYGVEGLALASKNQKSHLDFKRQVVEAYLSGSGSEQDLALRFRNIF